VEKIKELPFFHSLKRPPCHERVRFLRIVLVIKVDRVEKAHICAEMWKGEKWLQRKGNFPHESLTHETTKDI
jgi:hypothetical protein